MPVIDICRNESGVLPPEPSIVAAELDDHERATLTRLASELAAAALGTPDALSTLTAAAVNLLPSKLLEWSHQVRAREHASSGWVLGGLPIADALLAPTPRSWRQCAAEPTPEDCQLLLVGQALGGAFAWADQQGGATVHNIVPVAGEEDTLLSSSSTTALTLHTEDAYFTERADLLLLLCLRNPSRAATYVADIRDVALSDEHAQLVRSDRYRFKPDGSHGQGGPQRPAWGFRVVEAESPQTQGPSALVGGDHADPWLRCDIDYVYAGDDEEAMAAAHALDRALWRARSRFVLRPGEMLVIDNVRSVHGRGRFEPSFAGADRWIKRVNVSVPNWAE